MVFGDFEADKLFYPSCGFHKVGKWLLEHGIGVGGGHVAVFIQPFANPLAVESAYTAIEPHGGPKQGNGVLDGGDFDGLSALEAGLDGKGRGCNVGDGFAQGVSSQDGKSAGRKAGKVFFGLLGRIVVFQELLRGKLFVHRECVEVVQSGKIVADVQHGDAQSLSDAILIFTLGDESGDLQSARSERKDGFSFVAWFSHGPKMRQGSGFVNRFFITTGKNRI